jgi:hypothetical protein
MKQLRELVEQHNSWQAIFGHPALDINNPADRKAIAGIIDSGLSPENLTCDGELSHTQVQAKYRRLSAAAEQLLKLDPTVVLHEYY